MVLHCATVMPDHVHSVFTLGNVLTLSQTQGKFKALTRYRLEEVGLVWQDNFYDHRIRHNALLEPFARYVYLNPYRKRLIALDESWPGWVLNRHYRPEFMEHLNEGIFPPAAWVNLPESVEDLIDRDLSMKKGSD